MEREAAQAKFEGWAIVELMGHQTEIGFVTTENYGGASLFRVDRPPLEAREYTLERPEFVNHSFCPVGTKVQRPPIPPKSRLIGVGSIYAINPCDEASARRAIERLIAPPLILLELPKGAKPTPELPASENDEDDDEGSQVFSGN
jgi:hypothetical protein